MKNDLKCTEASAFYWTLLQTMKEKHRFFFIMLVILTSVSVVYSFFSRQLYSEAVLLISALDDQKLFKKQPFDIQAKEQFMEDQRTILLSDKVLGNALSARYIDLENTTKNIELLRSALFVERMPLDNTIILHLERRKSDDTRSLLKAIIQSYENWHISDIRKDVKLIRLYIHQALGKPLDTKGFLSLNNLYYIEILNSPSPSTPVNLFWSNLAYGAGSGMCVIFIVLYFLVLRSSYSVDQISKTINYSQIPD